MFDGAFDAQGLGWGLALAGGLVLALVLDWAFGEPPARLHPVVWIGRYLGWAGRLIAPSIAPCAAPRGTHAQPRDFKRFCAGAIAWTAGSAIVLIASLALETLARRLPLWLAGALLGVALKPMLAWRMLRDEVLVVEAALGESLAAGRERLAWLVSRDVADLSEAEVRESAIETLAENLNDSVLAPIFWFALLGLPGAAVYRFANTADAMWGYRGERAGRDWEWAGKWAARADDVLSWIPARLTAGLLALVAGGISVQTLRQEAHRTPSPNSGWPMAAMALALRISLRKPGGYALNAAARPPQVADTPRAIDLASKVVIAFSLIALSAIILVAYEVSR